MQFTVLTRTFKIKKMALKIGDVIKTTPKSIEERCGFIRLGDPWGGSKSDDWYEIYNDGLNFYFLPLWRRGKEYVIVEIVGDMIHVTDGIDRFAIPSCCISIISKDSNGRPKFLFLGSSRSDVTMPNGNMNDPEYRYLFNQKVMAFFNKAIGLPFVKGNTKGVVCGYTGTRWIGAVTEGHGISKSTIRDIRVISIHKDNELGYILLEDKHVYLNY